MVFWLDQIPSPDGIAILEYMYVLRPIVVLGYMDSGNSDQRNGTLATIFQRLQRMG